MFQKKLKILAIIATALAPDIECGLRLTFALLETETDSLECEGGYPESTIPRSQTGDRVGCINVARVRGSREQESARFALASLVATRDARSSSIKQTRHQKVANFVVEISVLLTPPMPKPYSYDLRKKVIEAPHARWNEEK